MRAILEPTGRPLSIMRIAPAPGSGRQMTSPSHSLGSTPQRSFKEWIRLNLSPLLLFLGLLVSSIAFLVLIFGALRRGEIHYVWINTPALIYTLTDRKSTRLNSSHVAISYA